MYNWIEFLPTDPKKKDYKRDKQRHKLVPNKKR